MGRFLVRTMHLRCFATRLNRAIHISCDVIRVMFCEMGLLFNNIHEEQWSMVNVYTVAYYQIMSTLTSRNSALQSEKAVTVNLHFK